MENELVVKSNSLATASYSLSVSEFRLLQMVFAEISKEENSSAFPSNHEFKVCAKDYAETFHLTNEAAYEALQESTNRLFNRYLTYWIGDKEELVKLRWIQKVSYSTSKGYITMQLTNDVLEMVGRSSGCFTRYKIKQIAELTSIYALKLYEVLSSYSGMQGKKTPIIELNELRGIFGLNDDEYTRMSNFKTRVLDLAIKQINESTNYQVKYEQHKRGRTIYGFSFSFVELKSKEATRDPNTIDWVDEQNQISSKPKRKRITEQEAAKLGRPGEEWPDLLKRIGSEYHVIFDKDKP